jgi:hypothetical protein
MWEKKTGTWSEPLLLVGTWPSCSSGTAPPCDDPHNVNNTYSSWGYPFVGTAATVFLKQLNDASFAGHTDWRLPTSAGTTSFPTGNDPELESILTAPYPSCTGSPCTDALFGPTAGDLYWSSSSGVLCINWVVSFGDGGMKVYKCGYGAYVRAVRGGP